MITYTTKSTNTIDGYLKDVENREKEKNLNNKEEPKNIAPQISVSSNSKHISFKNIAMSCLGALATAIGFADDNPILAGAGALVANSSLKNNSRLLNPNLDFLNEYRGVNNSNSSQVKNKM